MGLEENRNEAASLAKYRAPISRPLDRTFRLADRTDMSAIKSRMNRQVLRTILVALPKVLNYTASRVPAFRERLRQRDIIAWIGLQDGSIGRIVEIRSGKFQSRPGTAAQAEVTMMFKDVATALKLLLPNRDQAEIIHAAKNFRVVTAGPDDLVVWFTQTLNMSETAGLAMGTLMPDGSRRYTTCTNGGPLFVYVQDGRILRVTPIEFDDTDPSTWVIEARGRRFSPARRALVAPHALDDEIPGLFGQANPSPDEAGGFRSQRRTQSPEPRQIRLRADQLGRGAEHRRQGNQSAEARPRAWFHHFPHVVSPPVGKRGLLPERADALRQPDRLHPRRRQPRQLGGMVLGRHAPLRQFDARRRPCGLWRGGGLPQGSRDDRLLVLRS